MQKNILIVFGIFALCLVNSANAIKCYKCSSQGKSNCANDMIDGNSNIDVVDCDREHGIQGMNQFMAVTRCNKVTSKDGAGTMTTRGCHFTPLGSKSDVCTFTDNRQVEKCFTCTGDLCNSSSAGGHFMALGLAAIVAMVSMHFVF